MGAALTIRFDNKTRRRIAQIAERRRISEAEVIRLALNSWPDFHAIDKTPYELMADLIGSVNGGDPKRSENGGPKFKAYLKEKHKRSKL